MGVQIDEKDNYEVQQSLCENTSYKIRQVAGMVEEKDQGQLAVAARRTDKASQDTHGPGRIDQEIRRRRGRNKIVGHMSTIIAMSTSSGRTRTG
jgi:hypothetical protein